MLSCCEALVTYVLSRQQDARQDGLHHITHQAACALTHGSYNHICLLCLWLMACLISTGDKALARMACHQRCTAISCSITAAERL